MLILFLMFGYRVRFQILEWNYYIVEVDNFFVRNGYVIVQVFKYVSKSLIKFYNDVYWYWLMVFIIGIVRVTRYNVGEYKYGGDFIDQVKVKWFIDIRLWE